MRKNNVRGDALILTVSDQIEQLDYLLENLPDICFHIAAPVQFSEKIRVLESKYNVRLMTVTTDQQIDFLVNICDILLDINHFPEVDSIVSIPEIKVGFQHKGLLSIRHSYIYIWRE